MTLNDKSIKRLTDALRLETPIIATYDAVPSDVFEPWMMAKGRACCFSYYSRWLNGETLVVQGNGGSFENPQHGCPGMQNAFGLNKDGYPPWMANFLTDGKNGAPMGEGLKATPQLAQEFMDRAKAPEPTGDCVMVGPLKIDQWDNVRTLTFLVDPDRLAAVMTLATYWTSDQDDIAASFSSSCGLLWREMANFDRDRAVLGCTDIAMRKYLPPEIMSLTVSPTRFEKMVDFPEGAFLKREWWNELMTSRQKA